MIPETRDAWTLSIVEALLQQGVFESDRFDFKERLPHPKEDAEKLRLRKACASFANSDGGFLVFGVKDNKGLAPADRLVGLDPTTDFPEKFGNFPAAAEPSVEWTFRNPPLPLATGKLVHVVHIPRSPRAPHAVLEDGRWWFCKRTSKGTEAMSYGEVRDSFVALKAKIAKLRLVLSEVQHVRDLANDANIRSRASTMNGWRWPLPNYDLASTIAVLPDVFDMVARDAALVDALHALRDGVRASPSITWIDQFDLRVKIAQNAFAIIRAADTALPLLKKAVDDATR